MRGTWPPGSPVRCVAPPRRGQPPGRVLCSRDRRTWSAVLSRPFDADALFPALESGVALCDLASAIAAGETAPDAAPAVDPPDPAARPGTPAVCVGARPYTWLIRVTGHPVQARANVAAFLVWAAALGVPAAALFAPADLIKPHDGPKVLACLMEVDRLQRGVPASPLVRGAR